MEDIDYRVERGLNKSVIRGLAQESGWVKNHEHIFVLGPTGVGKSYVASALAQKACRDGYAVHYTRAAALFRDLNMARADGSLRQLLKRLNRIDVLVIDDWAMAPMAESERRDFWEIAEDRYQTRSMILTAQLPVSRWHEQIGDPTLADGILDRLVHNAHPQLLPADDLSLFPLLSPRFPHRFAAHRRSSPRASPAPSWSLPQHPRVDAPIGSAQNVWESRIDCHRANACGHGRARAIPRTGTKEGSPRRRPCAGHHQKLPVHNLGAGCGCLSGFWRVVRLPVSIASKNGH